MLFISAEDFFVARRNTMKQGAIACYFHSTAFNSYEGTLQSLAQMITQNMSVYINSIDLLEYFYSCDDLDRFIINICFFNGEIKVSMWEVDS